jgi:hypothetical protein
MGVGVVVVSWQIQCVGLRICPNDSVVVAVPSCIMFSSVDEKMLFRGLSQSNRRCQANEQRIGDQPRHDFSPVPYVNMLRTDPKYTLGELIMVKITRLR